MDEPQIIQLPEIRCVGVQTYGNNAAGEIPSLWPVFNSVCEKVKDRVSPDVFLGIETYPPTFSVERKWFYMAAVEVTSFDDLPVGAVAKVIPANVYAVFTYKGKLPGRIGEVFGYIYGEWLPKSGCKQAGPYDFERYGERFKGPDNEDSVTEICVPIEK